MAFGLIGCLFLLGFFLATEYVIALAPQSEQFVEKLEPHRSLIGLILAATGLWWTLYFVVLSDLNLFAALRGGPRIEIAGVVVTYPFKLRIFIWISYFTSILPASLLTLGGGFLLGFDKIADLTGKKEQLEPLRLKLEPYQRKIGVAALAVALWTLMLEIAW